MSGLQEAVDAAAANETTNVDPQIRKDKKKRGCQNEGPAQRSTLASALAEINTIAPWSLTVADVIRLTKKNSESGSSKLVLLELATLVEKASYGSSLANLNDALDLQASEDAVQLDNKLSISDFARAAADGVSKGYDEELHSACLKLLEVVEDPCERRDKIASADEKTKLVAPFLKRQPHQVSVDELCHVIEFLAEHGITDCTKASKLEDYHKCEDWFDSWLALHPNVARFLDPALVFMSPAAAAVPAGLTARLAQLPIGPNAVSMAPARLAVPGLAGGSAQLFRVNSLQDARSVSIAMRTHFANPVPCGAGGGGAQLVIGRFSTAGFGGITFV